MDIMTKAGYKITIYPTQCQGDAITKVRKNAEKYDLVVCSGGDGTLDEVVTGMEPVSYTHLDVYKRQMKTEKSSTVYQIISTRRKQSQVRNS